MAMEHARDLDILTPLREGEFHRITGIGPGIEQRLHLAGIKTFDHLASLSPEEINEALSGMVGMTAERVTRQDWIGKARELADKLSQPEPVDETGSESAEREYYQSFKVVLLLDHEQAVRSTRVMHVQDDQRESWAGWDPDRLAQWIEEQAGLHPAAAAPEPAAESPAPAVKDIQVPHPAEHVRPSPPIGGKLELRAVRTYNHETDHAQSFFIAGRPLSLALICDLTQVDYPDLTALKYRAWVDLRKLGGEKRSQVAEIEGSCPGSRLLTASLTIPGLEMGTYRLFACILVYPAESDAPERSGLQAITEGLLVQVHSIETELAN